MSAAPDFFQAPYTYNFMDTEIYVPEECVIGARFMAPEFWRWLILERYNNPDYIHLSTDDLRDYTCTQYKRVFSQKIEPPLNHSE